MGAEIPADIDLLPPVEEVTVPLSQVSQGGQEQGEKGAQLSHRNLGQCGTVGKNTPPSARISY